MRDLPEGVLEDGGSRKSIVGSRRGSSQRGLVGDQELTAVLEWQREGYCQAILTQMDRTVTLSNSCELSGPAKHHSDSLIAEVGSTPARVVRQSAASR